jgi:hypothetical protein
MPKRVLTEQEAAVDKAYAALTEARTDLVTLSNRLNVALNALTKARHEGGRSDNRICTRLQECVQKHRIGQGGERIDVLVCEEVDALREREAEARANYDAILDEYIANGKIIALQDLELATLRSDLSQARQREREAAEAAWNNGCAMNQTMNGPSQRFLDGRRNEYLDKFHPLPLTVAASGEVK